TVAARDNFGNPLTNYAGTVHFTCNSSPINLPADYTFTAADGGSHSFAVTLTTAGYPTITVSDTATAAMTGSQGIVVNHAAVARFLVSGFPSPATANAGNYVTVTILDAYDNEITDYQGVGHFTSSDPAAVLPDDSWLAQQDVNYTPVSFWVV